ncbi:MAG: HAMP domain-containing histidine kinase [Clostridiales bacterium]|uniref:sensor histidine kinase n=1 Tax=Clostridium sp. N3C TaxID=1776758 RepID=UPI00092E0BFB|nr:HAMP domain-containing sensor histidine kinase [Clostridium sp. N3C]NLZ48354.1 HAMP domain-containing histidine kinase [Clostridiales bacterium]SCN23113.1 Sensor histidine kinase YycG [Clostridium sp. N3C]
MGRRGLAFKTVVVYTLISTVCITIMCSILFIRFKNHYYDQRKYQIDIMVDGIRNWMVEEADYDSSMYLTKLKERIEIISDSIEEDMLFVNKIGLVHIVSDEKYNTLLYRNFISEDFNKLSSGNSIEKIISNNEIFSEKMYVYIVPVIENDAFQGAIVTFTPLYNMEKPIRNIGFFMWITAVSMIGATAFILYKATTRMVVRPLAEINKAAQKIAKGEVERRANINTGDEIGELAASFNTMADSLEKVENDRRTFISNVSHELRTPITSIKGFIGGVLDGVIPKEKEKDYLSIAYEEIQRLARLVNDLLDLSVFDAGKFKLDIGQIDINEIIRLCVIKAEARINQKELSVDVTLQDEHLYAYADRDRIIQVVTNLLDNAIKYVNDKGRIRVVTKTKGDKVLVSIFNSGPKIAEEDKKHIWERFYKSDKSRTSKVSTGLGLPIVRNILTQHGEDIWVENGEKEGVTFYFTLRKA